MLQKTQLPPGFTTVVIHGKVRVIPWSGNRVMAARQKTGFAAGVMASVLCTPFELAWAGLKRGGELVAETQEFQGAQYGFHRGQRAKEVWTTGRALAKSGDENTVRSEAVRLDLVSVDAAANMPIGRLASLVADRKAEDPYVDEESFLIPQMQVTEQPESEVVFSRPPGALQHA